ncbi:MAG: tubulin-like doman-containing protein [Pseudanabaena sp. Salubria-1]|nr:tubulin-like doman-containing protein [Pseudanabaena sp. Salubria-1]
MAEHQGMTPTVIIGVGGTGKTVLLKVRAMIAESYGALDQLPIVAFLHIDTDQNDLKAQPVEVLKQDISLRPVEQIHAKVDKGDAANILGRLDDYPHIAEWFPRELKATESILDGAGQVRALGRFAFTHNYAAIKEQFLSVMQRVIEGREVMTRKGVRVDQGVNVFVVCSLLGGTGSGMYLDLAYCLRDWIPAANQPQTSAYLVLPGTARGVAKRQIANAYAALMELNHYSSGNTRFESQYTATEGITDRSGRDVPFRFCYLVGNTNPNYQIPDLGGVMDMVAQNIFLDFSSGLSQFKKTIRDNISQLLGAPDALGYPQSFMTFGLSAIQFPLNRVLDACASRLAGRVASWWANPNPTSVNMRDVVKQSMRSLSLSEDDGNHQILDSISNAVSGQTYTKEVESQVESLRTIRKEQNIELNALGGFVRNRREQEFKPHFQDSDPKPASWSDYFRRMWGNTENLKREKPLELRNIVYGMLEDRFRGASYTRVFLQELRKILVDEYTTILDNKRMGYQAEITEDEEEKLDKLIQKLINNGNDWFKKVIDRKGVDASFENCLKAIQKFYTARVEVKSRSLAVQVIDELVKEIDALLLNIGKYEEVLNRLQSKLTERERTYIQETKNLKINGVLLFKEEVVDQIYKSVIADKESNKVESISRSLLQDQGKQLFDFYSFDKTREEELYSQILSAAFDVFEDSRKIRISAAQQFIEQYSTQEQETLAQECVRRSESFLRFTSVTGYADSPAKRQNLLGIEGGTTPTDPSVTKVLAIIRKATPLNDRDIKSLNVPHYIYFAQERGAFPLRMIEGMSEMRQCYRTLPREDTNPLHTHANSQRFPDLMPDTQQETEVKRNLILGRAFGAITEVRLDGSREIRFVYKSKDTGMQEDQSLGASWQEAEDFLLNDQHRMKRQILGDLLRENGQKAKIKAEKTTIYQKLQDWLAKFATELENGKANPEYRKAAEAIADYIKEYSLYIPDENISLSNNATAIKDNDSLNSNLSKFRDLVEKTYRNPHPSEDELQAIEVRRKRLGISEEDAKQIVAEFTPDLAKQEYKQEYALIFKSMLSKATDSKLKDEDLHELDDLQEELGLSDDEVLQIKRDVRKQLGLE